ncbi:probable alpha-mannosidase [Tanacetum coccineum]|uniref:Probable alpha-mannosidase n=1 Tax=Tanacetum coccineum TaxID=301880 RepID=A0ABQ5H9N1_9ASTR
MFLTNTSTENRQQQQSSSSSSSLQTTFGHKFIKQHSNVTPRIVWQIDPFGHWAVQAYLLGAEFSGGLQEFWFFFTGESHCAFSSVMAEKSNDQIFASAFPENYEPPSGFYFEVNDEYNIVQVNLTVAGPKVRVGDHNKESLRDIYEVNKKIKPSHRIR